MFDWWAIVERVVAVTSGVPSASNCKDRSMVATTVSLLFHWLWSCARCREIRSGNGRGDLKVFEGSTT